MFFTPFTKTFIVSVFVGFTPLLVIGMRNPPGSNFFPSGFKFFKY